MTVFGRIFWFSTAVLAALVGSLMLINGFVTGSSVCKEYEFPCDDGECITDVFWCDTNNDCSDGSDEKYCKKSSMFNKYPNKCSSKYFICKDGPCIPLGGRCDGFENCDDSSDEENCGQETSTKRDETTLNPHYSTTIGTENYHSTLMTDHSPKTEIEELIAIQSSLNGSQNSVQVVEFSGLRSSDFTNQRNKARNWILSQRRGNYGWGVETPRAITALYLSDIQPTVRSTESEMLMIKQLEMQLSLELARNGTKPMKLTDLALFINALVVSCKNPKNFYGDNLLSTLRDDVNAAQKEETFINPSIYLTLCVNNATVEDDIRKLHDLLFTWNSTVSRIDLKALTLLATACIFRKTNDLNASVYDMYDSIKKEFLRSLNLHGFPGNVYEAALLFQALHELKITLPGLIYFIIRHQLADGSFGDILSTYLVLPTLAGRNIVQINDHCGQQNTPDLIPLEVLNNVKSKKMHVQYSLNYGFPPEVTQTLQMHVSEGTNFLDVMRLAQEINPKYRFKLSENRDVPVIYSIGEMPNDVEKGMYWELYKASGNSSVITSEENLVPFIGDIKKLILEDGDKILFWYRPIKTF